VVTAAAENAEYITVSYGPDGHRSTFGRSWLVAHAPGAGPGGDRTEDAVAGCSGYVRETNYGRVFDVLADGFRAAALLREEDPGSFRVLTRTTVSFGFDDLGTALRACQPLIDLDPRGRIRGVRTAFTGAGERHLQGCYADLDSLASSLAVLERTEGAV
jgi:hypothetical protein